MMDGGDAWLPPSHLWDVGWVASSAKEGRWGGGDNLWRSSAAQPLMLIDLALGSLLWQPNKSAVMSGPNEALWIRLGQIKLVWRSGVPKPVNECVTVTWSISRFEVLPTVCLWSSTLMNYVCTICVAAGFFGPDQHVLFIYYILTFWFT